MIGLASIGIGLGVGLVIVGVGLGIGRIGGSAVEGISRQPEARGPILVNMIIAGALIEGAALFALVVVMLNGGQLSKDIMKEAVKQPVVKTMSK